MQENLPHIMQSLLKEKKLTIADVGATGGPELRWKKWEKLCFFYTFDPDPRAESWQGPSKNYPIGLWSKKCTKALMLATYPPATSLFKFNHTQTDAFLHHSLLQEAGKKNIALDALDEVLAGQGVDFLKVDAEGAELEILKGAKETIQSNCLGLQVEVCFCQIRQKAPLFGDIDRFVRKLDFQLFQLEREHWIRKNQISTFDSAPQLIWGNALYLLSKETFLKRMEESEDPELLLLKYLTILFAYRLYDYAYELCEDVSLEMIEPLKQHLRSLAEPKLKYIAKLVLSLLIGAGKYAFCLSKESKRHRLCYLKRKIREIGNACLYLGKNHYALYD